jgi:apolipoprotein N-acyltransferase
MMPGSDAPAPPNTPLFQRAVLRGEVTPREGATPYVRWRDWPLAGVSTALLVGLLVTGRRRFALFRQL